MIKWLLSTLPAKIILLSEEVRARQIEEKKRAKQFVMKSGEKFKQLYNEERPCLVYLSTS